VNNKLNIELMINNAISTASITDIHTHLFSECFGELFLFGIDELLTYHYLVAEALRYDGVDYQQFFNLSKEEQAEYVWKVLFVDNTPISEPARSVITILNKLGLDVNQKDLNYYREFFRAQKLSSYVDRIFKITNIKCLIMTNDPLDQNERGVWEKGYVKDSRFRAALRIDGILNSRESSFPQLRAFGYKVEDDLSGTTIEEIKRFLIEWIEKMDALYCAVSLPPDFSMLDGSKRVEIIENCVLPVCKGKNIPLALMIGVKRAVNPELRLAGDSLAKTDIKALEYLCAKYPQNKFLVTILSLENQHEFVITARKFRNLMPFGCWWYLNSPSLIEQITRMRLEWLGMSFIPQHSDCRVFEQLISKWEHSKAVLAKVLIEKYNDLIQMGYELSEEKINRDIQNLLGDNFWRFISQ